MRVKMTNLTKTNALEEFYDIAKNANSFVVDGESYDRVLEVLENFSLVDGKLPDEIVFLARVDKKLFYRVLNQVIKNLVRDGAGEKELKTFEDRSKLMYSAMNGNKIALNLFENSSKNVVTNCLASIGVINQYIFNGYENKWSFQFE